MLREIYRSKERLKRSVKQIKKEVEVVMNEFDHNKNGRLEANPNPNPNLNPILTLILTEMTEFLSMFCHEGAFPLKNTSQETNYLSSLTLKWHLNLGTAHHDRGTCEGLVSPSNLASPSAA